MTLDDPAVQALGEGRALVWDGWLEPAAVHAARAALEAERAAGALRPAHIGRGAERRLDPEVRGDWLGWLDPEASAPALRALWPRFEALRQALNEAAWLGLRGFELQGAVYPPGARYGRHLDAFTGQRSRAATAITYLNPAWEPAHGGLLRVFEPSGTRELAPLGGRLVVFLADRLPHEVLPGSVDRWALTAWFRGREDLPTLG